LTGRHTAQNPILFLSEIFILQDLHLGALDGGLQFLQIPLLFFKVILLPQEFKQFLNLEDTDKASKQ
jgi:hypothetical protein